MNECWIDYLCRAKLQLLSLADCKLDPKTINSIGEGLITNNMLNSLSFKNNVVGSL